MAFQGMTTHKTKNRISIFCQSIRALSFYPLITFIIEFIDKRYIFFKKVFPQKIKVSIPKSKKRIRINTYYPLLFLSLLKNTPFLEI